MMKRLIALLAFTAVVNAAFCQQSEGDNDQKGKFRKDNIFIGGGLNLGGGTGMFQVGVTPEIGYSITRWLDAGVLFIVNYQSQNNVYESDPNSGVVVGPFKVRNFNYGSGAFMRIWPVQFLHLTAQPEFNWVKSNVTYLPTGEKGSGTFKSTSFLVGIGYGSRDVGRNLQYITLMIDLMKDEYSPYRDINNQARPVVKAGLGFYLRPSKKK